MTLTDRLRHHITRRQLHPPLGFVHIPKAAGTAMVQQLDTRLRPRKFVYGLDRSQFGSFSAFETMTPSMRGGIFLESNAIPADADIIAGHISPTTIRERFPKAHLVTVLRAPETRLLSQWFYWRGYSDDVLAEFGEWGHAIAGARCEIADFLQIRELACVTDNLIVRMLLWPHPLIPNDDFIDTNNDATLINEAQIVLDSFSYVNVIDIKSQNDSLNNWLYKNYGMSFWTQIRNMIPDNKSIKINKAKIPILRNALPISDQISKSTKLLIADRSRLDYIIWSSLVEKISPDIDPKTLSDNLFCSNVMRYENLESKQ